MFLEEQWAQMFWIVARTPELLLLLAMMLVLCSLLIWGLLKLRGW